MIKLFQENKNKINALEKKTKQNETKMKMKS